MTCAGRLASWLLLFAALPAAAEPPSSWSKVLPADKSFSILFPALPARQSEKIDTPAGMIDVISYVLKPEKDRPAYLLSYSEFFGHHAKFPADKRLDNARDGALASTKGKLQSEKKLTLQDHPGRELFIITKDDQHLHTRIYVVGDRIYQLVIVGPPSQISAKDAGKFFDSFQVKAP